MNKYHSRNSVFSFFVLMVLLPLIGCERDPQPDDLIQEDTYIDILVEFQLIKGHQSLNADSVVKADSLQKLVFEKYEVSEEQFQRSHEFYQQQVEEQLERTDEAIERLQQERAKIDARIDSVESDSLRIQRTDSIAIDTLRQE